MHSPVFSAASLYELVLKLSSLGIFKCHYSSGKSIGYSLLPFVLTFVISELSTTETIVDFWRVRIIVQFEWSRGSHLRCSIKKVL